MLEVKREESFPKEHSLNTRKDHQSHFKQTEEGMHNIVIFLAGKLGVGIGHKKNRLMGEAKIFIFILGNISDQIERGIYC